MKKKISIILTIVLLFSVIILPSSVSAATETEKVGKVTLSSGWLNVRREATASSESVAKLQNGSYITILSKTGAWWKVKYSENEYGYSSATYVKEVTSTEKYVNIISGTLNVRSGAGSNYKATDKLVKGDKVLVVYTDGNWSYVLYDGTKTGYVSTWYLTSNSVNYTAIKLSVPSYKQTDSRWANVKLGTSGKRMADIGCATTGIAMMESYRTSTTIYPDAMSKKLKYTSSGSVYWPSYYTQVTSKTDYLKKIYEKIKSGKPVLFGAKNSSGGQHWVVITGYTGGDTISASKFTVNDPGSKNRKTLQDLFNTHPNFYKYFYY